MTVVFPVIGPYLARLAAFLRLDIHVAGIPVALFRLALRPPMRPNAKLGVAEPLGKLVIGERLPRRLELSGGHRLFLCVRLAGGGGQCGEMFGLRWGGIKRLRKGCGDRRRDE